MEAKHNHPAYVITRPSLLLALNSTLLPHDSWLAKETIALSPLPWPQNRNTGFVVGRMWSYNEEARVWRSACCKVRVVAVTVAVAASSATKFCVHSVGKGQRPQMAKR